MKKKISIRIIDRCSMITKNKRRCLNKPKDGLYCGIHLNSSKNGLTREQKMSYCYKQFLESKKEVYTAINKMEFFMNKLYGYA